MERDLPNFPLLFDRIADFFAQLNALREARRKLPPEAFVEAFDRVVKGNSPSGADDCISAFNTIVETMYGVTLGHCSGGGTRLRA
jgi:hypothetical protein